jgi:hypothetical protein
MMEAHLLLATIAQQYQLSLLPGHKVVPEALITMSPEFGLPMRVEKRIQASELVWPTTTVADLLPT